MSNMELWNKVKQPPPFALRQIQAGRLKGKSDINPMWRYQAMTEQFGPCGIGWKFEVKRLWTEPGSDGQVFAFAEVAVYINQGAGWLDPIPGIGGHFLVVKETGGLHANDEGYKMAVTDALGTAMKMLGVAADVYAGLWDGTKYRDAPGQTGSGASPRPENPGTRPAQAPQRGNGAAPKCPQCSGPMWDNRDRKTNPRAPDFKCKDRGCEGAIWPPKEEEPPPLASDAAFDPNDDVPF